MRAYVYLQRANSFCLQRADFYLSAVSVQEILYPRCILGHKIGGFRASEGLSKKHEFLSQEYFIMQIMDIKIKKLLLTLQKQTIGCMQSVCVFRRK